MLQFLFLLKVIKLLVFLTPLLSIFSDRFICVIILLGISDMSLKILKLKLQKPQIELEYQVN